MFGNNNKEGHKSWCGCCDGKDEKCRCFCHGPWLWFFVKGMICFIVLVFVFAAGVWVGKLSSWWHMHKSYYESNYRMMPYQKPMMPGQQMMPNGQYPWKP